MIRSFATRRAIAAAFTFAVPLAACGGAGEPIDGHAEGGEAEAPKGSHGGRLLAALPAALAR